MLRAAGRLLEKAIDKRKSRRSGEEGLSVGAGQFILGRERINWNVPFGADGAYHFQCEWPHAIEDFRGAVATNQVSQFSLRLAHGLDRKMQDVHWIAMRR